MKTLVCPKCAERFVQDNGSYICRNGHRFDISKSGYVNLILGNSGGGDDKEMCRSRHKFHLGDYYKCLSLRLARICIENSFFSILDAGCGEGYYLRIIREIYHEKKIKCPYLCGIDLAKSAIDIAARCEKNENTKIEYAVAGIFDIPAKDISFDCVMSVFAPVPATEAYRVLKDGGKLIVVSPGREHLEGLKRILYETPYDNDTQEVLYDGFSLSSEELITDNICVTGDNIKNLFHMTPYFWKTSISDKEKLSGVEVLSTKIQFIIRIFTK